MPFPLGPVAAAAASLIGGFAQNQQQAAMSRAQMRFQKEMRATQYQTAVEDMKKAGLNPMLAYDQGGAGTPSGSAPNVENVISPAVASAMQVKRMDAELKLMGTQRLLNLAQEAKVARETQWQETESKRRQHLLKEQEANARRTGAVLQEDANFAKRIGELGPGAKLLTQLLRLLR